MNCRGFYFTIVCLSVVLAERRRSPNYHIIEQLRKNATEASRYSNNLLEDASLDVPDLIRKYGYPAEVHDVVTEDGYILEVHRIPHGRDANNQPDPYKPVILCVHGLLSSSADWVVLGPGTAIGYYLAESGFDVWLANVRGNFYSRRHVSLDHTQDIEYWDFSWDEFGAYDLPAMIDYALETTGKERLHYIGHSQGTTSFWAMGSLRPEYNDKIITMQAFAPVAYLQYNENPVFRILAPIANVIRSTANQQGIGGLLHRPSVITNQGRILCRDGALTQQLCTNILFFIAGTSGDMFNTTMLPLKLAHTPAGMGLGQIVHYGQHIRRDHPFQRMDRGPLPNFWRFGSFTPPKYELHKVTAPVYFHYAEVDVFADLRDLDRLWNEIGNPIEKLRVEYEPFSHLDFIWGQYAKEVLYDKTIDIMKKYPNN